MLEKIPQSGGRAVKGLRTGHDKVVSAGFVVPATITLTSSAFEDDARIPARYTADDARISPPLAWADLPAGTESLMLIVEDPDAPGPEPFVHLIAWNIPPELGGFPEASFRSPGHGGMTRHVGRNSYLEAAYLPPDPPADHGLHSYIFQLFALDAALPLEDHPGRGEVVEAMADRVIAKGTLTGTYSRN